MTFMIIGARDKSYKQCRKQDGRRGGKGKNELVRRKGITKTVSSKKRKKQNKIEDLIE